MNGILLVNKPAGITSFGVVSRVRKTLSQAQTANLNAQSKGAELSAFNIKVPNSPTKVKVGHTGTLDPSATGLLILVIGSYTKRAGEFSRLYKTYEAEITLGDISTTADSEGEITPKSEKIPTLDDIKQTLNSFLGEITQVPPIYSAVKVGGKRAYKLARKGQVPALKPRKVTVYKIIDVHYRYPLLRFEITVSSGTYIRAIAQDIGEQLGTGAYLSALRRTKVGSFDIKDAIAIDAPAEVLSSFIKQI